MSDFRALLNSFQAATGVSNTNTNSSSNKKQAKTELKESIQNLWRKSQIQKSIAHQSQPTSNSKSSAKESTTTRPIHIAICATIVSTLPHEHIWRSWLDHPDTETATASMYIHAKTPAAIRNNSWLKSKCLPLTHNPNWNDIRIVKAMLSLIEYALKDERTTHVMFVTESCIPIATIDELADLLRNDGVVGKECCCSFLHAYGRDSARCTRFDEHACFRVKDVPDEAIYKALPGWCLLSKKHAKRVLNLPSELGENLYPLFEKVWAPEEVFFPTALSLLGFLPGNEVVPKTIMWAKWDERARGQERAHPIEYDRDFSRTLVRDARSEGCFFMRKLKKSLEIRCWESIIYSDPSPAVSQTSNRKRPRDDT